MPATVYAVLIADVMQSRTRPRMRALLGKGLAAASRDHLRRRLIALPYSVTAGDEFQTLTGNLSELPALILNLRAVLQPLPLRIGIGIGRVSDSVRPPVNRLSGEAFIFARQAMEAIKSNSEFKFGVLTAFASRKEEFNRTVNLIYGLHDTLVLKIKPRQWSTIQEFLKRPSLERTARRLDRDLSTVSRNLKRGYYWQLSETVTVVGQLIQEVFG